MNKILIRSFWVLLLITLLPTNLSAGNDVKDVLVVWTKDGIKTAYALNNKPEIRFTDDELLITGEGVEVSFPFDFFVKYTYENSCLTGIFDLYTNEINVNVKENYLLFPSLKANSSISIYTLSGKLIFSKTVKADGEYSFSLTNLQAGAYIIKVNGLTYKITKR